MHLSPKTISTTRAHILVKDKAQANFRPTGVIEKGASQAVLHQLTKALLLSDSASMNAKPELAIYHDDVECSHGVASTSLDKDALFYFGARGVSKDQARKMLLEAFVTELFQDDAQALTLAQIKLGSL